MNDKFNPLTFYDLSKRGGYRFKILANKVKNNLDRCWNKTKRSIWVRPAKYDSKSPFSNY